MRSKRQPDMAVILHHLAAGRHRAERDGRFPDLRHDFFLARRRGREQRKRLVAQATDGPERFASREVESRAEGVGLGELGERCLRHSGAAPEIVDRRKGLIGARADHRRSVLIGQAPDHAKPQADGETVFVVGWFERAIPSGRVHADRAYLDPVIAGVADDLRRRVKPHWLGIEQRGGEHVGVPAFEPGRGVGDQGEGCRV